ncbi:unnamed protein product [Meloidogyne enterolobii]|uniref:Uncharacterized protein n=1 Tax=Meloidogyne enterolobii TaxID=390850 RepID=A0ACB1AXI2_MELEN
MKLGNLIAHFLLYPMVPNLSRKALPSLSYTLQSPPHSPSPTNSLPANKWVTSSPFSLTNISPILNFFSYFLAFFQRKVLKR